MQRCPKKAINSSQPLGCSRQASVHACGQCLTCSGGVQRGGRQGWRGKVGKNAAMCFFLQAADCSGVCDVTVLRHPFGHPLGRAGKEQGTHPLTSRRTSGFWKRLGWAVVQARRGPVVQMIGAVGHRVSGSGGGWLQASGRDRVCSRAVGRGGCAGMGRDVAPLLDQPSWGSGRFKKRGCRFPRG